MSELPELLVADQRAWSAWLEAHHADPAGVWLVVAKKGTTEPTSLTYDQALEEALCHGWIDGQIAKRDDGTYRQRFTPRRARSIWSARNVQHVARLTEEGRMRPGGLAAVAAAKANGRWDAAYPGAAQARVPDDLAAALRASPEAAATFERLNGTNRFAVLYRVNDAKRAETRARRIETFVEMLARGEAPYPQKGLGEPVTE